MIFKPLALDGAFEVLLEPRGDARGFFSRFYCAEEFASHGLNTHWTQMNLSYSRGVYDVIVDLRERSDNFGHHVVVELDAERRNSIYIPEGFAHGFQTLHDEVELQYLHSQPYSPENEGGVHLMDRQLAINWPLPPVQMSERDRKLPTLKEVSPL